MKCHSSYSYETFSMLCFFLFYFSLSFCSHRVRSADVECECWGIRNTLIPSYLLKRTWTFCRWKAVWNYMICIRFGAFGLLAYASIGVVQRGISGIIFLFIHRRRVTGRNKVLQLLLRTFFSLFSVLQAIIEFGCVVSGHDTPFANIFPRIEISSELELNLQNIRHSRFDMRRPQAVTSATSVLFIETNAIYLRMAWVYTVNLSPLGISIRIATANTNIANICLATNKIYINSTRGFGNEILNWSTTFSSQTQCEYRNIRNFLASFA